MPEPEHVTWLDNLQLAPLDEGEMVLGAVVILKVLASDGEPQWVWRYSQDTINKFEAFGALRFLADKYLLEVAADSIEDHGENP